MDNLSSSYDSSFEAGQSLYRSQAECSHYVPMEDSFSWLDQALNDSIMEHKKVKKVIFSMCLLLFLIFEYCSESYTEIH